MRASKISFAIVAAIALFAGAHAALNTDRCDVNG